MRDSTLIPCIADVYSTGVRPLNIPQKIQTKEQVRIVFLLTLAGSISLSINLRQNHLTASLSINQPINLYCNIAMFQFQSTQVILNLYQYINPTTLGRGLRQIRRLLRLIYRPHHYYYIHVDQQSQGRGR